MHLNDLPSPLREQLLRTAVGEISPVILIKASTKVLISALGGGYIWSNGFQDAVWTDKVRIQNAPISISSSKPLLPADGARENIPQATEVNLPFINTDYVFAVTQLGSILNPDEIEQAQFEVFAQVGGQPYLLPMYKGRATGLPTEQAGLTIVPIRDSMWDLVRKPVMYGKLDPVQQTFVLNGNLVNNTVTVGTGSEAVEIFDGIVSFAEDGAAYTSATNTKPEAVELLRVTIGNRALPGKYTIKFTSATEYRVTYPDNQFITGNVAANYPPVAAANTTISINAADWSLAQNPNGAEITFYVSSVMKGNPVAIAEILLEWGLLDSWGSTPTKPATLKVDWSAFDSVRQFYSGFRVYMDATNRDNKVWLRKQGSKPQNILSLCQQVLDHIGAQITIDNFGFISIIAPGVYPREAHVLSDVYPAPAISDLKIMAQERSNYFLFKYGFNGISGNSSAVRLYDERVNATDEKVEKIISFPFYKQEVSQIEVESVSAQYMESIFRSFVKLEMNVIPNWILPIVPGDRFRVITTRQPIVDMFVEVYGVDKNIGGPGIVRAIKTQVPRTNPSRFCTAKFCVSKFC